MRVPARRMNAYAGMPDERVRAKYYDRMPRPDGIRQRSSQCKYGRCYVVTLGGGTEPNDHEAVDRRITPS